MKYNYPITEKNQHEPDDFNYDEYIDTSNDLFGTNSSKEMKSDIEVEMSNCLFDMRREFKRTLKKYRNLYSNKEPKLSKYEFQDAKSQFESFTKKQHNKRQVTA